ncbi:MAG: AgmX/PglI C-terminal domain-containing protein [Deltaproteobacteria bacterium]|nr:AgmX/PglI C-terminal domain-containing protein [Deltaproteobacteria bacterium]
MRSSSIAPVILFLTFTGCASSQVSSVDNAPKAKVDTVQTTSSATPTTTDVTELTSEVIQAVVKSHFEELQACYESTLASNNALAGIVELELTIVQDGSIEKGRLLKDGIGSAELNLCLVKKMVDWKFPAHTDESVTIEFPFAFSPKR